MDIAIAEAPLAYMLLLIIPAVSLYALFMDPDFAEANLFDMGAVVQGKQYHRLITSAFLHGDLGHLLVNMLTFFFFAPLVEVIYGTGGLALILLISQIGAEGLTLLTKRGDMSYRALGASGAISGVLFAFCVFAPMELIYVFFAIPMPAIVFAVLYVAYSTFAMGGPGRVAHEAHLGGALGGAALALLLPTMI